ncbi:MAG: fibronectin type III domain-containing protein [Proteobacteria bacterium]|nr:fibronectin type III domain-containing protein [Pseudomonadota bacterium]
MKRIFFGFICLLLFVSGVNATEYKLNWDDVENGDGYIVYYKDEAGNEFNRAVTESEIPLSQLNIHPGVKYVFAVTAYAAECGESERSDSVEHTIPLFTPPADQLPEKTVVVSVPAGVNVIFAAQGE